MRTYDQAFNTLMVILLLKILNKKLKNVLLYYYKIKINKWIIKFYKNYKRLSKLV